MQRYGSSGFGKQNLVGADLGTRFVQINLDGWDNHVNVYTGIRASPTVFDRGLGVLLTDLSTQPGAGGGSLLDETLIVAMGEFGRTVEGPAAAAAPLSARLPITVAG